MSNADNSTSPKCPKHETGNGPCYCKEQPPSDRRASRNKERMDKLRDVYQRVQARDPDPEAALRDVQEAVLVLLEEYAYTVFKRD